MNDRSLTLPSPAKLNLFLHINGRRADGYHELQTLFQFIDYCDLLRFELTDTPEIRLTGDTLGIPESANLVYRAAQQLLERRQVNAGIHIHLTKVIPMGGGLGGGSSNAATTLIGLNHLWRCGYTREELCRIGKELGADVPVFIAGHAAWAEGIGEILTPVTPREPWYLVVIPNVGVSTAEIFSDERLTRDTPKIKIAPAFEGNAPSYKNDCQAIVCRKYPEVQTALNHLEKFGNARMTGTGACVFVSFETETQATEAKHQLPSNLACFIAKGLNLSPLYRIQKELEQTAR